MRGTFVGKHTRKSVLGVASGGLLACWGEESATCPSGKIDLGLPIQRELPSKGVDV